jgi:uncharacterized repeat protein (TIGR02543 family)
MEGTMKIKKLAFYLPLFFIILSLLSIPIYGQGKLNIITSDGYIVSYGDFPSIDLPVKNFYFGDNDLIWVVEKKVKEIDQNFQPIIKISKDGTEIVSDSVNGIKGKEILLDIEGEDSNTKVFCDYPQNSLAMGKFRKIFNASGTYLAVFRAEQGQEPNKLVSHRIIKIIISEPTPPSATYSLTVKVNPSGGGTVTPSGGTYSALTTVTLTATPNPGYIFTGWSGDISGNTNPYTLTMNKNYDVTANFQTQGPGGPYSKLVEGAIPVNTEKPGTGYYSYSNFGIKSGEKKYFLIDPKKFGIPWNISYEQRGLNVTIKDINQGSIIDIYYPIIYKLTKNDELIKSYTVPGGGDFRILISGFLKSEYENGVKFLLEIYNKGTKSQDNGLTVSWFW